MEENLPPSSSKLPFLIGALILVVAGIAAAYLYMNPSLLSKTAPNPSQPGSKTSNSTAKPIVTSLESSKLVTFRSASAGGTVSNISQSEITITGSGETLTIPLKSNVQISVIKSPASQASSSAQNQSTNTTGTINDVKVGSKVTVVMAMDTRNQETELSAANIIVLP